MLHHNQGLAKTCIKKNHEIEFKIEIHQKRDKKAKSNNLFYSRYYLRYKNILLWLPTKHNHKLLLIKKLR